MKDKLSLRLGRAPLGGATFVNSMALFAQREMWTPTLMKSLVKFVPCLALLSAFAATSAISQATPPFGLETVQHLAEQVAKKPYEAPAEAPKTEEVDYDRYRQIRFRKERTVWRGEGLNFELQLLPTGWLFKVPVEVNIVEDGIVRPITPDNAYFDAVRSPASCRRTRD